MTNIWAQTFEDIRKPHFDMEDPYTKLDEAKKKGDGNLANNYPPYDKVTRGDVIAGALNQDQMGGKKKKVKEEVEDSPADKKADKAGMKKYHMTSKEWEKSSMDKKADAKLAKKMKEEVESLSEVQKNPSADKKVDVMTGKNKIAINPQIKEEVEAWVSELVEEGYDLSEFTWEDMAEIYEAVELEEGTAGMPAAGDAERVIEGPSKKLARAKIQKDMADVKYQRAVATSESYDSIVEYLSQRNDAFENLEEGVFDPKKSKLRPASERSQRTMTPQQRSAAKKAAARTAEIHSKGETVLQGLRPQGQRGKVKTTPAAKPAAPAANRTVKGRYDKLATAANKILKSTKG